MIIPSFKNRSTLATLPDWLASLSAAALRFPYVRLNATTCSSVLADGARAWGWTPYGESVIGAALC